MFALRMWERRDLFNISLICMFFKSSQSRYASLGVWGTDCAPRITKKAEEMERKRNKWNRSGMDALFFNVWGLDILC